MRLESPYCEHDGLNLSWETLEGLAKHNGPVAEPTWALAALDRAFPLELGTYPSLEAQVAAISDDIAYDNHDIDDGLRAGILDPDELLAHPFVAEQWQAVERRHAGAPRDRMLRELVRSQIGAMVNDVLGETRARLKDMRSSEDIRRAGRFTAAFSPAMAEGERAFKRFMYEKLYYHPQQLEASHHAKAVLAELFAAYRGDPALMGAKQAASLPGDEPARSRAIADYIAGMTDRFALARHAELGGGVTRERPAGLSFIA
jgi:dGTPase